MGKNLELFSFEFSLGNVATSCPNCGYHICNSILSKANLSKSFAILCCGTLFYLKYFHSEQLNSLILYAQSTLESLGNGILGIFSSKNVDLSSRQTVFQYIDNSNNVSNQIFMNTGGDDSNDFSSLNVSSLNSIGSSTVAKFDYLLDQIQQIKGCFHEEEEATYSLSSPVLSLNERRLSDGETTLPSLEWDLGDILDYNENGLQCDVDLRNEFIDADALSHLIFNKDFVLNEEKLFIMQKQFRNVKHRLKYLTRNRRRNQFNLDSLNYKTNRDSAFFEEFS